MQKRITTAKCYINEYIKNNNKLSNTIDKNDLKKDAYNRITNSEQFYSRFRHCI